MGRFSSSGSRGHRCRRDGDGFVISWTVDFYYASSRLCHPRSFRRYTDERGARRFCKRHGIPFPERGA
jgi:hypothetical protein